MRAITVLMVSMLVLFSSTILAQTIEETYQQGVDLFNQGKYSEARDKFITVLEKPANPYRGKAFIYALKSSKGHDLLEEVFGRYLSDFRRTEYEAEARLLRGDSLRYRKEDYEGALSEYSYITENFPNSPHLPMAYLNIVKSAQKLRNKAKADEAFDALCAKFPDSPLTGSALYNYGEFYSKDLGYRTKAIEAYLKVMNEHPDVKCRWVAMLRAADLVPDRNINRSIEIYKQVLEEYPNGKSAWWAQAELGVAYYLKDETAKARECFEKVLTMTNEQHYVRLANRYIEAIDNPDSIAHAHAVYDRGLRRYRDLRNLDQSFWDFQYYVALSEKPFFKDFLNDSSVSEEEKAEFEYRIMHSWYMTGRLEKARLKAEEIIQKYPGATGQVATCLFTLGFLAQQRRDYDEAIVRFENLLDQPLREKLEARTFKELARCYRDIGETLTAAQIYDHMAETYGPVIYGEGARRDLEFLLLGHPDLQQQLSELKKNNGGNLAEKIKPAEFLNTLAVKVKEQKPTEEAKTKETKVGPAAGN